MSENEVTKTEEVEAPLAEKLTRSEFVARLEQLIAEGEAAGLPTAKIIAAKFARDGTRRITSVVDDFLDGLAGNQ